VKHPVVLPLVLLVALATTDPAAAADPTKKECVTANEGGQDFRRAGQLHDARQSFTMCSSPSCPRAVRDDCAQRLTEVDAAMPTLQFGAKDAQGHDVAAVHVTMDGQPLIDSVTATSVGVDPGPHRFGFEADGFRPADLAVDVHEGDKDRSVQVVLESLESATPAAPAPAAPASEGRHVVWGTQRGIGLGLGIVGLGGVALGTVFSLLSKSTYDHAVHSECAGDPNACSAQGVRDGQTAHNQATLSTVAFIAGGALFAGGLLVFFTAPSGVVAVGPTVSKGGAGLSAMAAW
jgi:hypothetical protein